MRKFPLLILLLGLVLAIPATALVIDDFESGDSWAVSENGGFAQSNLTGVTGGRRFIQTTLPGVVSFHPGNGVSWTLINYFKIAYDPDIGALEFLQGNPAGSIVLSFSGLTHSVDLHFTARNPGHGTFGKHYQIPAGTSSFVVPTMDIPVAHWDTVEPIAFAFTSYPAQMTGTLTRIEAIPEPSTALLLGIGLAGLGMRRRQRTRRGSCAD